MGMYDDKKDGMIITITRKKLLSKLKKNRKAHKREYKEALVGWQKEVSYCLAHASEEAEEGEYMPCDVAPVRSLITDTPRSHVGDYDIAISMLEWHTGEEFKIERGQFEKYVLDNWSWKGSFDQCSIRYSTTRG